MPVPAEFQPFPKIARLYRECIITEKIDGANSQIIVGEDGSVACGSRSRLLSVEDDNFGFAAWVRDNEAYLFTLGPGAHFGEWWGSGIQRRYGITEKRFSLFNTSRWNEETKPKCCHVVPVLATGIFSSLLIEGCMNRLRVEGSVAVPGCMRPEGIIIYHIASGMYFKATLERDEEWKGKPT
jgi:hypothetical protein